MTISTESAEPWIPDDTPSISKQLILEKHVVVTRRMAAFPTAKVERLFGLSFPCYRRVGTFIIAPGAPPYTSSTEMIQISPLDLADAKRIDASTHVGAKR